MAWIKPITDWGDGDTYSYMDWNRVIVDADILLPLSNVNSYWMTENDFLTTEAWDFIVGLLYDRAVDIGLRPTKPGSAMTSDNFNALELLLILIKEQEELLERQADSIVYVGDDVYASSMGQYTGVTENYVR